MFNIINCKLQKPASIFLKYNLNRSQKTFYKAIEEYFNSNHVAFPISGKIIPIKNLNSSTNYLQINQINADRISYNIYLVEKANCNNSKFLSTSFKSSINENIQELNPIKNTANILVIISKSVNTELLEISKEYSDIHVKFFIDYKTPMLDLSSVIILLVFSFIIAALLVSLKNCIVKFENYRHERNIKFLEVIEKNTKLNFSTKIII